MSRAPFVMPKAEAAFSRANAVYDTTLGWRFVNPKMKAKYGIDQMPETAENVAAEFGISRADQDAFALRSQQRALAAQASGVLAQEIVAVTLPAKKGEPVVVAKDEHPRETSLEALAKLKPIVKRGRHGHRRQRLGRERRRLRAARRLGGRREAPRTHARARASSAWPLRVSHPASWASDRRRPRRSCSPGWASRSRRWTCSS